jgi:hypothetical protein
MEPGYDSQRPRYLLCSIGFWLLTVSFGLLGLCNALPLIGVINNDNRIFQVMSQRWWTLSISLPLSYMGLLGSYLLWGRWSDMSWQRRAGLMVLLSLLNSIAATLIRADDLGFVARIEPAKHTLSVMIDSFGWVKLFLAASLATEVASQLGRPTISEAGRLSERVALFGLALCVALTIVHTSWRDGWPLQRLPARDPFVLLGELGAVLLKALSAAQVATLCFLAAIESRRTWRLLVIAESELDQAPPLA